jgi:ubiquitin C-terminal hydrolase
MDKHIGVSKFKNMGATCYLNSILHILQEIPEFQEFMINNDSLIHSKTHIYEALHKLFKLSSENDDKVIIPASFKKLIGQKSDIWDGYDQQDSQEFFSFLISSLEEEIGEKSEYIPGLNINFKHPDKNSKHIGDILQNIIANKSSLSYQLREYSPLSKMFNGLIRNKKTCSICHNIQYVYEPFITLSLTIPLKDKKDEYTLYDCLNNMIEVERLTSDNKLTCDLCGVKNKFYSETMLWHTPNILAIQLKRFINNDIISHKINNNVSYPLILDMENYFDKNSSYGKSFKYHLVGVNIHLSSGKNINFGHYISFVKNKLNKSWYIYNDENPIRDISEDDLIHNNAYMLFYIRE